jgi:hypothetical protein
MFHKLGAKRLEKEESMTEMTKEEVLQWYKLMTNEKIVSKSIGFESDYQELIRLNHLIMEASHDIHNANMLRK